VLADGTNSYSYGLGRIGEEQPGGWQFHLGDALGSVRQLTNAGAAVGLEHAGRVLANDPSASGVLELAEGYSFPSLTNIVDQVILITTP
jgi:hypothetical protein